MEITHHLFLKGGLTKVGNAWYRGGETRVYVDSAPHFVANAALNHYRLDGEDAGIVASGNTISDVGLARQISRRVELKLALDNVLNRK